MISLYTNYPKFLVKEVKDQNVLLYDAQYNEYIEQNHKEAMQCFLNSHNMELCKNIMVRIENDMKFSKIFMIFITHEQP